MKINTIERGVLERLVEGRESDYDFCYMGFAPLCTELAIERKAVRRACRSLARKGLAEYGKGLWNDNGEPAGSGYAATTAGAEFISAEFPPEVE